MAISSYLDTSFLVKGYLNELESPLVEVHVRNVDVALWVSPLTDVEMAATLAKRLGKADAEIAWLTYKGDRDIGVFVEMPITPPVWDLASELLRRQGGPSFLGSLDALHLATALHHGATQVATFDRRLAAAATVYGLSTVGVGP